MDLFAKIGNTVILLVLCGAGAGCSNCQFRGPDSSFLYSYMRLLSATDITFLLHTVVTCAFVDTGFYIGEGYRDSSSRALEVYVWNCLTPLWNVSASASDIIITAMTFSR